MIAKCSILRLKNLLTRFFRFDQCHQEVDDDHLGVDERNVQVRFRIELVVEDLLR